MTLVINSKGAIEELARSKKKYDESMMGYAKKYKACGFVPFTLNLGMNKDGKKYPFDIPSFSAIDSRNCLDNVNNNKNCMALRMGTKIDDDYYIVLFDVDMTEDDDTKCGMTKWKELLEGKKEINTPTQKTGNNGLHYLFKVSEENFNKLPRLITKIVIDGVRYSLDFKGENQMMFVAPTNYHGKSYKWIIDFTEDIEEMPKWLLTIIMKAGGKPDQKKQGKKDNNTVKQKQNNIKTKESPKKNNMIIDLDGDRDNDIPIMKNISLNKLTNNKSGNNKSIHKNNVVKISNSDDESDADSGNEEYNKEYQRNNDIYEHCAKGSRCYFSFKKTVLKNILSGLDMYENRDEWLSVGMALKNESINGNEYFDLWNEWSKKSRGKYKGKEDCKITWNGIEDRKTGRRYTITYLIDELEKRNKDAYNIIKVDLTMLDALTKNKDSFFVDNECKVESVEKSDKKCCLVFSDAHCPTYGGVHSDDDHIISCRKFAANPRGKAYMECTHKYCVGKTCPKNGIQLDGRMIKNIFVVNNYTINNYNTNKWNYNIKLVIKDMTGVFTDEILNDKMIKSFDGDIDIADAISHVFHDIVIFTESNEWYYFSDRWKKSTNVIIDIVSKFCLLYNQIKNYIDKLDDLMEVEKVEFKDQVNYLVSTITNEKHNKNIISYLQDKCKVIGSQIFDKNKSIFAFKNGVYDFETMSFRQITPSDMITRSTGYDYSDSYVNKQNLLDVISNMFESREKMESFLLYVAMSICSNNDMNPVLLMKWTKENHFDTLTDCLCDTFGEYHCSVNKKGFVVKNNITIDENYIRSIRLFVVESINYITNSELRKLANVSVRSINITNKNKSEKISHVNFSTICMCEDEPNIPNDEIDNFRYIAMTKKTSINKKIHQSDFFLLLVEYLKKLKINNGEVLENINDIKIDNRTPIEKLCDEFIEEYFEKGDDNDRCKGSDILEKLKKWAEEKKITKPSRPTLYKRMKIYQYTYQKTIRFPDISTTGFLGIKVK